MTSEASSVDCACVVESPPSILHKGGAPCDLHLDKRSEAWLVAAVAATRFDWLGRRSTLAQDPAERPCSASGRPSRHAAPPLPQDATSAEGRSRDPSLRRPSRRTRRAVSRSGCPSPERAVRLHGTPRVPTAGQCRAPNPLTSDGQTPRKAAWPSSSRTRSWPRSQLKRPEGRRGQAPRHGCRKSKAGIKRWESLLGALKQSQGAAPPVPAPRQADHEKLAAIGAGRRESDPGDRSPRPKFTIEVGAHDEVTTHAAAPSGIQFAADVVIHAAWTDASRLLVASCAGSSKIWPGGPDSMTRPVAEDVDRVGDPAGELHGVGHDDHGQAVARPGRS